jgi:hypothetical protein
MEQIILKQEDFEIDFSKIKNIPKVETKEGKLIIDIELKDGKKNLHD